MREVWMSRGNCSGAENSTSFAQWAELDGDIESGELGGGANIGVESTGLKHSSWCLPMRCFDGSDENVDRKRPLIGGRSSSCG
jgi:hypothetical protein